MGAPPELADRAHFLQGETRFYQRACVLRPAGRIAADIDHTRGHAFGDARHLLLRTGARRVQEDGIEGSAFASIQWIAEQVTVRKVQRAGDTPCRSGRGEDRGPRGLDRRHVAASGQSKAERSQPGKQVRNPVTAFGPFPRCRDERRLPVLRRLQERAGGVRHWNAAEADGHRLRFPDRFRAEAVIDTEPG
ncbi:hypothetical protein MTsPCn7_21750 [Altererythrobacter sp. MTPC7]